MLGLDYLQVTPLQLLDWLLPPLGHKGWAWTPWPSSLICWLEAQHGCSQGLQPSPMLWESLIPPSAQSPHPFISSFSLNWLSPPFSPSSLSVPRLTFPIPLPRLSWELQGRECLHCSAGKETWRPGHLAPEQVQTCREHPPQGRCSKERNPLSSQNFTEGGESGNSSDWGHIQICTAFPTVAIGTISDGERTGPKAWARVPGF